VKIWASVLAVMFLACGQTARADEFQNLTCGADIAKAMIGKRSANEPVVALEKKYRAIGLKNLGGDEISDSLSSVNSLICGAGNVELIDRRGMVRDAIALPSHTKSAPSFSGMCRLNGKELPDIIVGVLDAAASTDPLPIKTAWKIDQKQAKFVALPAEGLTCPRSSITTPDGGQ
jgi:hypothetical protein